MSFPSKHADRIWQDLYDALIPDFVTMDRDFIRKFGVPSSGDKEIDKMMSTNTTFVKIPIIKILEHFENGIDVQIPARKDMIAIHKNIELYLEEWRGHLVYDINLDKGKHKDLLLSLEKLSKLIFEKAYPTEVVDRSLQIKGFGLQSPLRKEQDVEVIKPDYNGISSLLRPAIRGRF